ncbi:MAG: NUDIX hydrolase [Anaerolineae bacterium]
MNKSFLRGVALPILRWYWKVFKPKTYGVKVIIQHPNSKTILVVRHSYGDQTIWSLPGGGYRPNHESPESAAKHETKEELGIELTNLQKLGEYKTSAQGKRDRVTIFLSQTLSSTITSNSEIAEFKWMTPTDFVNSSPLYQISKHAMHLLKQKEAN